MKIVKMGAGALVTALVAGGLAVAPAAFAGPATAGISCTAKANTPQPKQFTTEYIHVHTARYTTVTTVAKYKTTSTTKRITSDKNGNATTAYAISDATPGYKVLVNTTVVKGGSHAVCQTSFTPVSTSAPKPPAPAPGTSTCGAPANPWGYNFCGGGTITAPPAAFCSYFSCIKNFPNGTGYVVQCKDSTFSKSGGKSGACSDHGGELRALNP